jgi:hypothetical protein
MGLKKGVLPRIKSKVFRKRLYRHGDPFELGRNPLGVYLNKKQQLFNDVNRPRLLDAKFRKLGASKIKKPKILKGRI